MTSKKNDILQVSLFLFICLLGCFADSLTTEIMPTHTEQIQQQEIENIDYYTQPTPYIEFDSSMCYDCGDVQTCEHDPNNIHQ